MARWKVAVRLGGFLLMLVGISSVPDDLANWCKIFASIGATRLSWALVAAGFVLLVAPYVPAARAELKGRHAKPLSPQADRIQREGDKVLRDVLASPAPELPAPDPAPTEQDQRLAAIALELKHELRAIRELAHTKQGVIAQGIAAGHERGFRFPTDQWEKYRSELNQWPVYYSAVSSAYSEVERVNRNIVWLEGRHVGDSEPLGLGPVHDLPAVIGEADVAITALDDAILRAEPPGVPQPDFRSRAKLISTLTRLSVEARGTGEGAKERDPKSLDGLIERGRAIRKRHVLEPQMGILSGVIGIGLTLDRMGAQGTASAEWFYDVGDYVGSFCKPAAGKEIVAMPFQADKERFIDALDKNLRFLERVRKEPLKWLSALE